MTHPTPPSFPSERLIRPVDGAEEEELRRRIVEAHRARLGEHIHRPTIGARIADKVAATVGSWPFIIVQTLVLVAWIALNCEAFVRHWDPYPFILLNLGLSFQAAYAAPFIMMSQNRQAAIDRSAAEHAYDIDVESELEIELLHHKVDELRLEHAELTRLVRELHARAGA